MRVVHVGSSDIAGGAARAAYRLHRALVGEGLQSSMLVHAKASDDDTVLVCGPEKHGRFRLLCRLARDYRWSGFTSPENNYFSRADESWGFVERLSSGPYDLVHLHWLGSITLTVEEIGRIPQPVVWTLHDMWGFCGAEHYLPDGADARFRTGYRVGNRPPGETGADLNRWVWERKVRSWKRPMVIVCPSRWLAACARESELFKSWPVFHIPNPLDIERWRPMSKDQARLLLGLPLKKRIVLFGATGGAADPRKGSDLLWRALHVLRARGEDDVHLAVFGQSAPAELQAIPYPVTWLGRLHDDASMIAVYNAADVIVVPSRQDNLPQTAVEAQACGIPVVAFNIGGLPDIVEHEVTGYLARPDDVKSLAEGIEWVLDDDLRREALGVAAQSSAKRKYSAPTIAKAYRELYEHVLKQKASS